MEIENALCKEQQAAGKCSLLGLKICACILKLHGGNIETSTTKDNFHVVFSLPVSLPK
jgi:K+-sensing histidine kinase KdpD